MAKDPEIPQTDPAEIEILIERLKDNKLEKRDVELIERLLRTVMVLVGLLQRKNMSIKRLRDLIFGRHTEKRKATGSGKEEEKPEGNEAIDAVTERNSGVAAAILSTASVAGSLIHQSSEHSISAKAERNSRVLRLSRRGKIDLFNC
jgi:hypothetical protein